MKINIENIPSERTRKEIEKEYGYYCQLDWKSAGCTVEQTKRNARRLYAGRTISRAMGTKVHSHGGARGGTEYNWEGVTVNRNTVYGRIKMGWSWEQAISIPVGHKKT